MAYFLNTFTPLCINGVGKTSAIRNNLPLFVDGSCRREPDFENPKPAITQLCRPTKLVTRLDKNDLVIYLTRKGKYGEKTNHWKLIAVLEVIDIFPDHDSAEQFYLANKLTVSQNVICKSTLPLPLNFTHKSNEYVKKFTDDEDVIKHWDTAYHDRARRYPEVAVTQVWNNVLFLENAPIIDEQKMISIFNRIPGTQTPPKLSENEWRNFRIAMSL